LVVSSQIPETFDAARKFSLPDLGGDRHVELRFDGVYQNADVWLNGVHLGFHPNGYTSFAFDLTPHLLPEAAADVVHVGDYASGIGETPPIDAAASASAARSAAVAGGSGGSP
jgi:Glycosyl hydrolases family 2, sugar binding domain